jgi:uncharacterized membrane protein
LFQQSIRLDEAQSVWLFSKSVKEMLRLSSQDVNLPLYGLILHFWLQIFGTEIIWVRLPSLIFYWLTIIPLFNLAKESGGNDNALMTVALFSLSPFIVWYTSEARTYTLFTLISTINNLYFLRIIRSSASEGKLGFFLSTAAGLYTHYFFIFLLISQGAYFLILKLRNNPKSKTRKSYLRIVLGAFLLFLPWLIYVFLQGSVSNTQPLINRPNSYNIIQSIVNFVTGFQPQNIQSLMVSMWPLSVVILFFVFTHKRKNFTKNIDYFFLCTFLPIILVFIVSILIKPIFLPRYLILTTPTLFLTISWLILNNSKKVSFWLSIVLLFSMLGMLLFQNSSSLTPAKENYSRVVNYINEYTTPNDIVAVSAPFTIYPVEYLYKGPAKLVTIPLWDRYVQGPIPQFNLDEFKKQIEDYQKVYNKVYVVLSYDQGYEKDLVTYLDTHYAIIGTGKFSEDIELRVYKLKY